MRRISALACAGLTIGLLFAHTTTFFAQGPGNGMLTSASPVFLFPDATRTPLATLPSGTTVRILARKGDWYQIEFRDQRFGDRTGYVTADRIQLLPATQPARPPATPQRVPSAPQPARGSRIQAPREPTTVAINAGVQTTSRGFTSENTGSRFAEDGTVASVYSGDRPVVYDVSIRGGLSRGFSVGVAVTYSSKPLGGEVTAEVPHPFFFNQARTVSGHVPALPHQEIAVHFDGGWTVSAGGSTRVTVFGGPSYFRATQGLVTDVEIAETYPFEVASFVKGTTTESTQSRWGANVGLDVTQRLSRYFGVGVIARYSRATLTFPIAEPSEASIKVGGVQVGVGARFQF